MCAHPYDYCGPTYTGECGTQCAPNARAGSILSEPLEAFSTDEMGPQSGIPDDMMPVPDDFVGSVSPAYQSVERVRSISSHRTTR